MILIFDLWSQDHCQWSWSFWGDLLITNNDLDLWSRSKIKWSFTSLVSAHSDSSDRLEGPVGAADGVTVCHYLRLPENLPPPLVRQVRIAALVHRPFSESTDNLGGRGRRTEARQEFFSPAVWPLLRFATTNRTVPPDIHSLLPSVASSPRWTLAFFKSHSKVRWLKSTRPPCVTQPKMA